MKHLLAATALCLATASALFGDPPALYFYPPPAIFGNYRIYSPLTLRADEITTQFPEISEMSGVGLLICWSTICPKEDRYDFSIIDQALAYWGAKGKKVALGVGTIGFPIRMADGSLENPTPDWVLKKVSTFQQTVMVIPFTPDKSKQQEPTTLPSYFDPRFIEETRKLVNKLGERYDGNPALETVRIGTGIYGEDNATFDGLKASMPGWSKSNWIHYCQQMTDIYEAAFHKSQLEFDEGWVSVVQVYGTPEEQAEARAFMQSLRDRHVFLAFNGLSSQDYPLWAARDTGKFTQWERTLITDLSNLQQAKAAGCPIGLEAIGPKTGSEMQDTVAIANMVKALQPDRVLLFDETPMLIRNKRLGVDLRGEVPKASVASTTAQIEEFFQLLGYK